MQSLWVEIKIKGVPDEFTQNPTSLLFSFLYFSYVFAGEDTDFSYFLAQTNNTETKVDLIRSNPFSETEQLFLTTQNGEQINILIRYRKNNQSRSTKEIQKMIIHGAHQRRILIDNPQMISQMVNNLEPKVSSYEGEYTRKNHGLLSAKFGFEDMISYLKASLSRLKTYNGDLTSIGYELPDQKILTLEFKNNGKTITEIRAKLSDSWIDRIKITNPQQIGDITRIVEADFWDETAPIKSRLNVLYGEQLEKRTHLLKEQLLQNYANEIDALLKLDLINSTDIDTLKIYELIPDGVSQPVLMVEFPSLYNRYRDYVLFSNEIKIDRPHIDPSYRGKSPIAPAGLKWAMASLIDLSKFGSRFLLNNGKILSLYPTYDRLWGAVYPKIEIEEARFFTVGGLRNSNRCIESLNTPLQKAP